MSNIITQELITEISEKIRPSKIYALYEYCNSIGRIICLSTDKEKLINTVCTTYPLALHMNHEYVANRLRNGEKIVIGYKAFCISQCPDCVFLNW